MPRCPTRDTASTLTISFPQPFSSPSVTSAVAKSAWAGLAAGCLHTLSGPDHLAALTPLTVGRSHTAAALLGGLWGFGHCVGQLVLGLAMIVLKDRFTSFVPALSKYGSATVGGTLLAIGAVGLYETWAAAAESGDGSAVAAAASAPPPPSTGKPGTTGWTLAAGVVYGLQPDALFVIVPALALPSAAAAAAYMVAFVGGTVGAMASYAAAIGAASRAVADATQSTAAVARLSAAASVVAVAAGAAILAAACGVNVPWVSFVTAH